MGDVTATSWLSPLGWEEAVGLSEDCALLQLLVRAHLAPNSRVHLNSDWGPLVYEVRVAGKHFTFIEIRELVAHG